MHRSIRSEQRRRYYHFVCLPLVESILYKVYDCVQPPERTRMFLSAILYSLGQACNIGLKFKKYIRVFRIDLVTYIRVIHMWKWFFCIRLYILHILKCVMGIVVKSVERIVEYINCRIFEISRRINNENIKRTKY